MEVFSDLDLGDTTFDKDFILHKI